MRWFVLFFAFIGICVCVSVTALNAFTAYLSDPVTQAARQEDVWQSHQNYLAWAPARDALLQGTVLTFNTLAVLAILFAAAVGAVWVIRVYDGRQKMRTVYAPDRRGLLPVTQAALDGAALVALAGYHEARIEAARHPQIPASVTHYSFKEGNQPPPRITAPEKPALPAIPILQPAPPFARFLADGQVGPNKAILVGTTSAGQAHYTTLDNLVSAIILGVSGSGKTRLAALLAAQAAVSYGTKLALVDPHRGSPEALTTFLSPLDNAFWREPVGGIEGRARWVVGEVLEEMERRKQGAPAFPLLLLLDEFTWLMALDNGRMARNVEFLVNQGRKYDVKIVVCGQSGNAERTGGTTLRNGLASAIFMKCRPQVARAVWPGIGNITAGLERGQALFAPASYTDPQRVAVPLFERSDAEALAKLLPPSQEPLPAPTRRSDSAAWSAPQPQPQPQPVFAYTPPEPEPPPSARPVLRIVREGEETDGRTDGDNSAESRQNSSAAAPSDRPTDRPTTLVAMAKASRQVLTPDQWDYLVRLDNGETPQAVARAVTGQDGGRPYGRLRDEIIDLAHRVRDTAGKGEAS